jgi:outer membrane protein OmpA-like peptidoglycan-associated protein
MKSIPKILIGLVLLTACSKSGENTSHDQEAADSINLALYGQVTEVHDEIMPKMEVIYSLKERIEDQIDNTPGVAREQELERVILRLDSASNSMLTWMQKFEPRKDSFDKEKTRLYLTSELENVKKVQTEITESIAQAEAELKKESPPKSKSTAKNTARITKRPEPTPTIVKPFTKEEKKVEPVFIEPVVKTSPKRDSVISRAIVSVDSSATKKVVSSIEKKHTGKPFYFKVVNVESGAAVTGEVHIVESKATQYQGFKANELVYLIPPKNAAGVYQVSIQAPGYKPAKLAFNYKDPSLVSSGIGEQQETIVTFELVRTKKGDYIDFNDVRFFRNSTILEPQSQSELNGLVDLMKESPKYKVKIHGHCNGDEPRPIITLGSGTNVFALDPAHNSKETATAKRLTELRAETVKNYLISQGIDGERIGTKGEGGKMMIYARTSTVANRNDRVEIEVLRSK